MYYHIILTEECNSRCKYCYEKSLCEFDNGLGEKWEFDFDVPSELEFDVSKLNSFLKSGDGVIFYGGEPLINFKKMKEIIDSIENHFGVGKINFFMQTNAKILNIVPENYMKKFSRILVSIDGNKERTDYNRGKHTYDLVLKNLRKIRNNSFCGEIVARMTISQEFPDLFEQVRHLVGLIEEGIFSSVHWQIDAGFYKTDFNYEKFRKFVEEYNKNVLELINFWINYMKVHGEVLRFYPFVGIFNRIVGWDKTKVGNGLMCGSGFANYTIATDGKIVACPIMNNVMNFCAGDLDTSSDNLKKFEIGEPCKSCDYLRNCGGRCLYSNQAKLWPPEGEDLVCKTVKFLIDSLNSCAEEILELINAGVVKKEDFEYEKYFGPEIIP